MKKNQSRPSLPRKNSKKGQGGEGTSEPGTGRPSTASGKKDVRIRDRLGSDILDQLGEVGSDAPIPLDSIQSSSSHQTSRRESRKKSSRRWTWKRDSFLPQLAPVPSIDQSQVTQKRSAGMDSGFSSPSQGTFSRRNLWADYEMLEDEDFQVILLHKARVRDDQNIAAESEKSVAQQPDKMVCKCIPIHIFMSVLCVLMLLADCLLAVNGVFMMKKNEGPNDPKGLGAFYIIISVLDMVINIIAIAGIICRKGGFVFPWEVTRFFTLIVMFFALLKFVWKDKKQLHSQGYYVTIVFTLLMSFIGIIVCFETIGFMYIEELYHVHSGHLDLPQWENSPSASEEGESLIAVKMKEGGSKGTMKSTHHKLKIVEPEITSDEDAKNKGDRIEKQVSVGAMDNKTVHSE